MNIGRSIMQWLGIIPPDSDMAHRAVRARVEHQETTDRAVRCAIKQTIMADDAHDTLTDLMERMEHKGHHEKPDRRLPS